MSTDLNVSSASLDSGPLAEISQGPNAFEVFLDRHQKNIVILAILLVLGIAGLVIYQGIEKSRQMTAGAALAKAEDLAAFQAVVNDHSGTHAGGSAMLLLANSQWTAGKKDDAIGTLQKFISSNPQHSAIVTAKVNLGSKLMAQGKSGDASKVFEELVSDPAARFIAPFALISLGDLSKASGNLEKAETSYNEVKSKFPDSSFAEMANRRIDTLKAKAPAEIEAPAAPPAPALPAPTEPSLPIPGAEIAPPIIPNP